MLPSGLPETVDDDEPLARFLTSRGQFSTRLVKVAAFLPAPRDNKTSVFRHGTEPRNGLVGLSRLIEGRNIHGVAICLAKAVRDATLEVESAEPPPRHADIVGWSGDPLIAKARNKELAARIAASARMVLIET